MNSLYITIDKGRTHIARESAYVGSINSYNNFFTRLISKLFGKSMDIEINDKIAHVNIKSYSKFLRNTNNEISLFDAHNLNDILKNFSKNRGLMRSHLSAKKQRVLFRKLVNSLISNNFSRALKLIGKGAEVDSSFWMRDNGYGTTLNSITFDLPNQPCKFKAVKYTPLSFAAKNKQKALVKFLLKVNASADIIGKEVAFKRKITKVDRSFELGAVVVPTVNYVRAPRRPCRQVHIGGRVPVGYHRYRHPVQVQTGVAVVPTVEHRVRTNFKDTTHLTSTFFYDTKRKAILKTAKNEKQFNTFTV